MADEPIPQLGCRTPLMVAHKPCMDMLAAKGRCGLLQTIPDGFESSSEVAHLTLLGYDVRQVFEGKAVLEAASMGIDIFPGELALRCNLVCIEDGCIKNHSAGHISTEEAQELITYLNIELSDENICFYPGISYRHLLKMKDGNKDIDCMPPQNGIGIPFQDILIKSQNTEANHTAKILNALILKSQDVLKDHPINRRRMMEGKDPANSIWLSSPGYRPVMKPLINTYNIRSGSVISAVDLIKGIGMYAGLKSIDVVGATGLYDTNYEGKAQAALEALKNDDFVFVHVEASDEAAHSGDFDLKVKTIEALDARLIKPIYDEIIKWDEPVTLIVLPDHPTSSITGMHTREEVPFIVFKSDMESDNVAVYDEYSVSKGFFGSIYGLDFLRLILSNA